MQWITSSPFETQNIGGLLAGFVRAGDCITIQGDLGMGKTTLARGLIQSLVPAAGTINSPSFNLVAPYTASLVDGSTCQLLHVDLYRVKHEGELPALGLEEAFDSSITIIEWPEIALSILPKERLQISLSATPAMDTREINATGNFLQRMQ